MANVTTGNAARLSLPRRPPLIGAVVGLCIAAAAAFTAAASEGAYLTGLDAVHMQRAGAGVASPRSAAWMLVNPAGLVALEDRLDTGFTIYNATTNVRARGLTANWLVGSLNSESVTPVPFGGMVTSFWGGKLGLGMYVPAGSMTDLSASRDIPSYLVFGNMDRRLSFQHIRLVAAYARQFENGWALGAGVHGSLTRLRTDHLTLRLAPTRGDNEWDEAPGFGFGLGIYKDWDRVALGLSYTSCHWVADFDEYTDLLPKHVDLPQSVQAGIAVKLSRNWELCADYRWIDWTDVNIFGASVYENSLDWDDQDIVKLGIEWRATTRYTMRAGWSHGQTVIDRDHAFLSMLTPATVEDQVTAGFTVRVGERSEVHFTYLHAFPHTVRDTGTGEFFSYQARNTSYHTQYDALSVGYSLYF